MKQDIKKETLKKIKEDNLKPKPKIFFRIMRLLLYSLSALLILSAVYIFNLMFYLPGRSIRMLGSGRFLNHLSLFPWPLFLIGAAIIGLLVYLYRNYEGGYKKRLDIVILIVFGILLVLGGALAGTRINQRLEKGPQFQRFYQWNQDNFVPRGPRHNLQIQGTPRSFR